MAVDSTEDSMCLFEITANFRGEIDGNDKGRWKETEKLWSRRESVRRPHTFEEICFLSKVD